MIYFTSHEYFEKMITLGYVPSQQTNDNADELLKIINPFITYLFAEKLLPADFKIILTSGWRSVPYNEKIGGAKFSNHCIGKAIDIAEQTIINLCQKDPALLEKFDLYAESALDTKGSEGGWTHLQSEKPASGNRIFRA